MCAVRSRGESCRTTWCLLYQMALSGNVQHNLLCSSSPQQQHKCDTPKTCHTLREINMCIARQRVHIVWMKLCGNGKMYV